MRLHSHVDAYVDGELTGSKRLRMAAHLAACFTCSGTAETLRLIKHSLGTRPQRTPPDLAEARLRRYANRLIHADPARPAR
jgi:anti-sigma factor RsiW